MNLEEIKETVSGYEVKELRHNKHDNILSGRVKCPLFGKDSLHDGFVTIQWNMNGFPIRKHKGLSDYQIKIN
jgi:hypothetical protein